jgi:hypothetical protein
VQRDVMVCGDNRLLNLALSLGGCSRFVETNTSSHKFEQSASAEDDVGCLASSRAAIKETYP